MTRRIIGLMVCLSCGLILGLQAWSGSPSPSEQLQKLFQEDWEFTLRADPLLATRVGDPRYNDRLPSVRLEDFQYRLEKQREFLHRLQQIDRTALSPEDQLNYDIFKRLKENEIALLEFHAYLMPLTSRTGFHIDFAQLPDWVPLRTVQDYENYIARLRAFSEYVDQHIVLLREAIKGGYTLPRVVLQGYEETIRAHIVEDPTESLLYRPFREFPPTVPESERPRLRAAGRQAITESVIPGYRKFYAFMVHEYIPAARESIAIADVPNGRAYYRFLIRYRTTLDVSPEQVHELGLAEVRRIRREMETILQKVKFKGNLKEFINFLRTDSRFYVDTSEQLLKEASFIAKRMDGQLPRLFRTLPRTPYGIRAIPDYVAPKATTAYYEPPTGDGTTAGFYYVNTYNLKARPLYELEALTLHEAVPGHHLQIALQMELKDLPPFRRFFGFTAFTEGWALYAERLGKEVGFYQDPYSDFGRLSYEMWRACRLVVDTGIHYFGWTRQRAIDFMAEHTALTLHNIETEVDRYISWPAQALAYKMGELKIRELRRRAEQLLGERFDLREFHDVVLRNGAIPLDLLEQIVDRWIQQKRTRAA